MLNAFVWKKNNTGLVVTRILDAWIGQETLALARLAPLIFF